MPGELMFGLFEMNTGPCAPLRRPPANTHKADASRGL